MTYLGYLGLFFVAAWFWSHWMAGQPPVIGEHVWKAFRWQMPPKYDYKSQDGK
jgi:hypothetical protein